MVCYLLHLILIYVILLVINCLFQTCIYVWAPKTKDHEHFNYYIYLNLIVHVLSHVLGIMGRYSVFSFHILTVFDISPLELVRFQNSGYFVCSCSFSCPTLSLTVCVHPLRKKGEESMPVVAQLCIIYIVAQSHFSSKASILCVLIYREIITHHDGVIMYIMPNTV